MKTLIKQAPRDFYASLAVVFLGAFAFFALSLLLITYLTTHLHFQDWTAGLLYGSFGACISLYSLAGGQLLDRLWVRRATLLQVGVGVLGFIGLALSTSNGVLTSLILMGPIAFSVALAIPISAIAIRRYLPDSHQSLGYGIQYGVVNAGIVVSQLFVDQCRLHYIAPAVQFSIFASTLGLAILITLVFIRDVQCLDVLPQEWTVAPFGLTAERGKFKLDRDFWRFAAISGATIGVKAIQRYLDTLYPSYMHRAPFVSDDVPYISFLIVSPILSVPASVGFLWLITYYNVDLYHCIIVGTLLTGLSVLFMLISAYWAIFAFLTLLTLGDAIWYPCLTRYALFYCKEGQEGTFFAMANLPSFAAKVVAASLSGVLLQEYCWAPGLGGCHLGWVMWLYVGVLGLSSPLLLVGIGRWVQTEVQRES